MKVPQTILILLIEGYRKILSPMKHLIFGPAGRCRFTPTCSGYALEAIQSRGALNGSWLAFRRICRCHPWGGCGFDPVPPRGENAPRAAGAAGAGSQRPRMMPAARAGRI